MAKNKKNWKVDLKFEIHGKVAIFNGRAPKVVPDPWLKAQLLKLGVFTNQPDGKLKYTGAVNAVMDDGKFEPVDQNGEIELDFEAMPQAQKVRLQKEFKEKA